MPFQTLNSRLIWGFYNNTINLKKKKNVEQTEILSYRVPLEFYRGAYKHKSLHIMRCNDNVTIYFFPSKWDIYYFLRSENGAFQRPETVFQKLQNGTYGHFM